MSNYPITLITEDQQTLQFDCQTDEDIISAAERQQIILPQLCRNGACGFCTALHVEGQYQLRDYNPAALTAPQHALLCRTYPQTALTIHANYPYTAIQFGHIPQATCQIVQKTAVTAQIIHLVLEQCSEMDNLLSANLQAGQYMQLHFVEAGVKRAYSLANPANWTGQLEFYIQLWHQGAFSALLQQAQMGDKLVVQGALGEFVLDNDSLRPRWFIGGGTGLSPLLAMLRHMAEFGDTQPARLFWGTRQVTEVFAEAELQALASQLSDFTYQLCVSHPTADWTGYHGSVITALEQALGQCTETPDLYVCGSERLINGVLTLADAKGIDAKQIFYEKFA